MSARRTSLGLLTGLLLAGNAAALPAAVSLAATPAAGAVAHVTIQDFAFKPPILKIKVGTKVIWTNKDAMAHDVTAANGRWHSGTLNPGQTYSHTFKTAGTFTYDCTFHDGMTARVVVSK